MGLAMPQDGSQMQSVQYSVGSPYPNYPQRFMNTGGGVLILRHEHGTINVLLNLNGISKYEADAFRTGRLSYGLFIEDGVCFFLLAIQGVMYSDCSLNMLTELEHRGADCCKHFIEGKSNTCVIFLVDSHTGIVRGIRAIGLYDETLRMMRKVAENQLRDFKTSGECDKAITVVQDKYTVNEMIAHTTMITLIDSQRLGGTTWL